MADFLTRVALAGLVFLPLTAATEPSPPDETIRISRGPTGLHSVPAVNYEVTLSLEREVAVRQRSGRPQPVRRYSVPPSSAARARAALAAHRPHGQSRKLICRGEVFESDAPVFLRGFTVYDVEWEGGGARRALSLCDTERERVMVDAVRQALKALNLTPEGRVIRPLAM